MPEPVGPGQRYVPGLDGIRAFAVLAVIAYHLGFGWASGGLLGVGVFFTLSGYLITDLLLTQYEKTGHVQLRQFWIRRARRLLPAVIVLLVVVTAWVTVLRRSELASMRGAVASALTYVSNWWLISQHVSYFSRFGPPSPLSHLWSLAVEEQFYLVWPWLVVLGLVVVRHRRGFRAMRVHLALATLVLAAGSALTMGLLYHPSLDTTRIYDGTDTRAFGLLIGAALAFVWPSHRLSADVSREAALTLDAVGIAALVAIVVMMHRTNEYSSFIYQGGLVLLSVATALLLACVVHPASWLGRALGMQPLRWIGVRSYGIYLWHYPVIVLTTSVTAAQVNLVRAGLQTAATFVLAALSWRYVENPIRQGAFARWRKTHGWRRWRLWLRGWRAAALGGAVALLATSCVGMSQSPHRGSSTADAPTKPISIDVTTSATPHHHPGTPGTAPSTHHSHKPHPATPVAARSRTTSCKGVVHIGDSTSEGMVSPDYLPDPHQRLDAQYANVGVTTEHIEISGGTSILETVNPGEQNAYEIAQGLLNKGFKGCWVMALGTNDTADVYVGSAEDRDTRIEKMMSLFGSQQPVIWVTVKSLLSSGPYSEKNMQLWNQALLKACTKYPNMRVYDWASVVQSKWFIDDGIHYTSAGYAARARLLALALAHAEPAIGSSKGCVVH